MASKEVHAKNGWIDWTNECVTFGDPEPTYLVAGNAVPQKTF